MIEVELGAAPNEVPEIGGVVPAAQRLGAEADPREELGVAHERHLHRLGHAGDAIAQGEAREEELVVDDRVGRREGAEVVLLAERIDAVLHADARVGLREHGRGEAHDAHAAMGDGRGVPHHVEHCPASHHDHERVPVEPQIVHGLEHRAEVLGLRLDRLAPGHIERRSGERDARGMRGKVGGDTSAQLRLGRGEALVDHDEGAVEAGRLARGEGVEERRARGRERITREDDAVLEGHRDPLEVLAHGRRG